MSLDDRAGRAASLWDNEYQDILGRWTRRMQLDLEQPRDRLRCVFARCPFAEMPRQIRSRLLPKDIPDTEVTVDEEDKVRKKQLDRKTSNWRTSNPRNQLLASTVAARTSRGRGATHSMPNQRHQKVP